MLDFSTHLNRVRLSEETNIERSLLGVKKDLQNLLRTLPQEVDGLVNKLKTELMPNQPSYKRSWWDSIKNWWSNVTRGTYNDKNPFYWQNRFGELGRKAEAVDMSLGDYRLLEQMHRRLVEDTNAVPMIKIRKVLDDWGAELKTKIAAHVRDALRGVDQLIAIHPESPLTAGHNTTQKAEPAKPAAEPAKPATPSANTFPGGETSSGKPSVPPGSPDGDEGGFPDDETTKEPPPAPPPPSPPPPAPPPPSPPPSAPPAPEPDEEWEDDGDADAGFPLKIPERSDTESEGDYEKRVKAYINSLWKWGERHGHVQGDMLKSNTGLMLTKQGFLKHIMASVAAKNKKFNPPDPDADDLHDEIEKLKATAKGLAMEDDVTEILKKGDPDEVREILKLMQQVDDDRDIPGGMMESDAYMYRKMLREGKRLPPRVGSLPLRERHLYLKRLLTEKASG